MKQTFFLITFLSFIMIINSSFRIKKTEKKGFPFFNNIKSGFQNLGNSVQKTFSNVKERFLKKGPLEQDLSKISSIPFDPDFGKTFAQLASFSYCDEKVMKAGKCCSNLKEYKLVTTATLPLDEYTYAILRNDKKKQIVVTMTGTKNKKQLIKEIIHSRMVRFREPQNKMTIVKYFHDIYRLAKPNIKKVLLEQRARNPDYQFIFTGHSLGGAMSTILALDAVLDGYVTQTKRSPLLINFGSPRAGNFYFAQNVLDRVPLIYRIVRKGDPVVSIPPCTLTLGKKCSNSLNLKKFVANARILLERNLKKSIRPWHIPGLILYDQNMKKFENCGKHSSDHHSNKNCIMETGKSNNFLSIAKRIGKNFLKDGIVKSFNRWKDNIIKEVSSKINKHLIYFDINIGGFCSNPDLDKSKKKYF